MAELSHREPDAQDVCLGTFWSQDGALRWSDEVFEIHGFEPGDVVPTVDLMLAHCDPADRDDVALVLTAPSAQGPRAVQYRLTTAHGGTRWVALTVDRVAPAGVRGTLLDLTSRHESSGAQAVNEMLASALESRAVIDQAKGALQVVYALDDEAAFDVLRWCSQQYNVRVRSLAQLVLDAVRDSEAVPEQTRRQLDRRLGALPGRAPSAQGETSSADEPVQPPRELVHTLRTDPDAVIVAVTGDIDLAMAPQFAAVLSEASVAVGPGRPLLVDLVGCDYFGPAVLAELIATRRRLAARGTSLHLIVGEHSPHGAAMAQMVDTVIMPSHGPDPAQLPPGEIVTALRDASRASPLAD